jgi:hypothetical protein
MPLRDKKLAMIVAGVVLFYLAMAEVFLLALPKPHEPLQYMVAGAFATAISLLVPFVLYALGRLSPATIARTVRGSGRSS